MLGVLQGVAARALQASRHLHEPDDLRHLLVAGLGGRHQIGDAAAPGGVHPLQGRDERQRDLVLLQIEPRRLAGHRLRLGVVEQIVRDLERHPERAAEPRQRVTVRRSAAQGAHLARPGEQRGRLGLDQRIVLAFPVRELVVRLQLAHLADRHLVGHAREHPQRRQVLEAHQLHDRAGVEVVPHDHGHLMREQAVDRRHPAAQRRVVHRIVMDQRRQVDELDDSGEGHRARVRGARPRRLRAEQQQRRPEQLPFHAQEVFVDFGDDREVRRDEAPQLVHHPIELPGHGPLDVRQGDARQLLGHVNAPWRAP